MGRREAVFTVAGRRGEDGCGLLIFILEVIENGIENRIS